MLYDHSRKFYFGSTSCAAFPRMTYGLAPCASCSFSSTMQRFLSLFFFANSTDTSQNSGGLDLRCGCFFRGLSKSELDSLKSTNHNTMKIPVHSFGEQMAGLCFRKRHILVHAQGAEMGRSCASKG